MEHILDLYHLPEDPARPVICMDEQPVQMIRETRVPTPATPNHPERFDYEYERGGSTNVFMFNEPLTGWRRATVCTRKTALDWAEGIRRLLEEDYPFAEKVILVCDNLSTHTIASLYKAFPPEKAHRLAQRLELHFTPKHGSWLNMAEIELSILTRQCLQRRIPDETSLRREVDAWQKKRTAQQKGIDWQFSTKDARIKLRRLYPQIQM